MTKYNNENTTIAAYRVFETLKFLIKQPASVSEILKHLESLNLNEGKIYSKGVIYKYIATLKFAGIDIARNKCKYKVRNLPFKLPFDDDNFNAILILEEIIKQISEKNITENIEKLLYSLKIRSSLSENEIYKLKNESSTVKLDSSTEKQTKIIERYEKYCNDNLKLSIEYQNIFGEKCKINCEPKDVNFKNNQVSLYAFCELTNDFIELNSEQITKIVQLPTKCNDLKREESSRSTVFSMSGKLAKRYKARSKEIISFSGEKLVISNRNEAKNKLLTRIMRYGKLCEIESPKMERKAIKEMIAKTLSNYNINV